MKEPQGSTEQPEPIKAAAANESELQLLTFVDSLPQLAWMADASGHIFWYNKQWYDYTGTTLEQMQGWGWQSVHDPEILPRVLERWTGSIKTGESFEMEFPLRAADGQFRWFLTRVSPLRDPQGNIVKWFGTNTDVDELRRAREENARLYELAQKERTNAEAVARENENLYKEAQEANRLKDEFLATVSHELRTPLTSILGWASMLLADRLGEDEKRKALEIINRSARAQVQLIDDLLDISRIISGKLILDVSTVDLRKVIELAVDAMRPAIAAKKIKLQLILDFHTTPISGDANRLQQIIWNLLSNSVKFTAPGGKIQIRLEQIDSQVEIVVSDNGQEIAAEFLPYVFDRFRQADSSNTRQHGGLGLGLSIVRHLIEMHGGSIRAVSPGIGQGATFTIILPIASTAINLESSPRDESLAKSYQQQELTSLFSPCLEGLNILVVDDDEEVRVLVETILSQCKANVFSVGSAIEALAVIEELKPDLLVSDIGMPEMNGFDLIREIRAREAQHNRSRMPAVALTAFTRMEDRLQSLNVGYQLHIPKPIEPADLIAAVTSLVALIRIEPR